MRTSEFIQRLWRKVELLVPPPSMLLRVAVWGLRGGTIGRGTRLPACRVTWPHQVRIGSDCELHPGVFFNYSHYWTPGPSIIIGDRVMVGGGVEFNCRSRIEVADDALIAAGCRLIDSDHGIAAEMPPRDQPLRSEPILIDKGAWLGANTIVLRGVRVGAGAVVGAGSVVTHNVPDFEIWAGSPARKIGTR